MICISSVPNLNQNPLNEEQEKERKREGTKKGTT
jgi:hypothetical protein